jgi:serine/threonine protein kinase/WD40 repeat protein
MPDPTQDLGLSPKSLDDLLAECIAAEESGRAIDLEALIRQHPEHAAELREFLANRDQMRRIAEPLQGAAAVSHRNGHPLGKIRYFGDYELVDEIAAGGMGIVYKARQVSLNRIVAVKMILKGTLASNDDVKRFRAEAEAAANLQHPGIVAIHEVGLHEGQHYFSMDFVDGQSLAQVPREQPLSAKLAAEYVRDAAEAVHYAHQQGTLHRDLKPSNILIDRQGRVRITDFGLAKRIAGQSDLTLSGQILGTPSYMPPEQAVSKRSLIGTASDVYSLGAVLYELLAGRPPFRGETPAETLRQVESLDPLSPRLLNPATPRDLETICLKCLEKELHKRYLTAQHLADDLGRFLRHEPILARPISRLSRAWRWCRRNQLVALLGAVVTLLTISTAIGSTVASVYLHNLNRRIEQQSRVIQYESTRALDAERVAIERLWESLLAQARATRNTRQPGQRFASLRAIQDALKLPVPKGRSLNELRTEAIGCLLLPDLEVAEQWAGLPAGYDCLAIESKFQRYAHGEKDGTVSVRQLSSNQELWRLPSAGRLQPYWGLGFSPDGRLLFQYGDQTSRLWHLEGTAPAKILEVAAGCMAFRPDGKEVVVTYRDGSVRIHDTHDGQELRHFDAADVGGFNAFGGFVRWNPKQPILAIQGLDRSLRLVDTNDGHLVALVPIRPVDWIAWHPDGRVLAIADGLHDVVYLWDIQAKKTVQTLQTGRNQDGTVLSFSHAGDRMLTNDWNRIWRLWDVRTGDELLSQPAEGVCVAFSAEDTLVGVSASLAPQRCRVFRYRAGSEYFRIAHRLGEPTSTGARRSVWHPYAQLDADGELLAISGEDGISLVDIQRGEFVAQLPLPKTHPLHFEPHNAALLTYGVNGLVRWPAETGAGSERIRRLGPPQKLVNTSVQEYWGCSADAQVIAVPGNSRGAFVFRRAKEQMIELKPQEDVRFCAVSPNGRWVATGSHNFRNGAGVKFWDAQTGALVRELAHGEHGIPGFSPDSKRLVTRGAGIKIRDLATGSSEIQLSEMDGRFAFSHNGELLALEDVPGVVRLVAPATGREVARLTAPEKTRLEPLCFTPDGGLLITAGTETGMLHVFNLRAIRRGLVELGLDWDQPPLKPENAREAESGQPWTIEVDLGQPNTALKSNAGLERAVAQ